MPEVGAGHEPEGWDVHEHPGYGLAAALYALAFLGCAVAAILFAIYFPGRHPRPWPRPDPEPSLNARLDSDPHYSYAARPLAPADIQPAMRGVAAQGDAGWGTKAATPPAQRPGP